jgi:hypothetical protein
MSDGQPPGAQGAGGRYPHHELIHRRFRRTVMTLAMTLPVLILFWVYDRTVACWSHGGAGAFEAWLCPDGWLVFVGYGLGVFGALIWVHRPVNRVAPRPDAPPLTGRRPVLRFARFGKRRDEYDRGFSQLDVHTRETLLFSEWLVPAVIALAVVVVQGVPRLLR